jgi:hypothetical protein
MRRLAFAAAGILTITSGLFSQEDVDESKFKVEGKAPGIVRSPTAEPPTVPVRAPDFSKFSKDPAAIEAMQKSFTTRTMTEEERERFREELIKKFEAGGADGRVIHSELTEAVRRADRATKAAQEVVEESAETPWPAILAAVLGLAVIGGVVVRSRRG